MTLSQFSLRLYIPTLVYYSHTGRMKKKKKKTIESSGEILVGGADF